MVKYTVVDDFGYLINPMLAEGQVHGGVVQGIGQAVIERVAYSPEGQLLVGLVHGLRHAAGGRRAVHGVPRRAGAVDGQRRSA